MTADPLTAVHPLEAWRATFTALSRELGDTTTPAVALRADVTTVDVRLPSGTALDVLGHPLPAAVGTGNARAYRLGPDEWLVTDPAADGPTWERELLDALRPHGGAAIDVTAQRTGLRLGGETARELLAFGCSLDLRPTVFGPGSCAETVVWGAPVLLAADDDGVDLFVRTSYAGHLAARLLDAAQELRPDPALPLLSDPCSEGGEP